MDEKACDGMELNVDVHSWLKARHFGYQLLQPGAVAAAKDFILIWSVFEDKALSKVPQVGNSGRRLGYADRIIAFANTNVECSQSEPIVEEAFEYFRNRYVDDDRVNNKFDNLHFRGNDRCEVVKDALLGGALENNEKVKVLLLIAHRIRNNFIHGLKWEYNLKDQRENFYYCIQSLMAALDRSDAM